MTDEAKETREEKPGERASAPRPTFTVTAGSLPDGSPGVAVIVDHPKATVSTSRAVVPEHFPGAVMEPHQARALAYLLLHCAETQEHGRLRPQANLITIPKLN